MYIIINKILLRTKLKYNFPNKIDKMQKNTYTYKIPKIILSLRIKKINIQKLFNFFINFTYPFS